MSESVKAASAGHPLAARGNLYRAAIVGAASLKGKEVAEMLNERNFPAADVRLLDDEESMGKLEAMGDEVSFIQRVRAEQFEHVDFTFFAADQQSTRKSWKDARDAGIQQVTSGEFGHFTSADQQRCMPFERVEDLLSEFDGHVADRNRVRANASFRSDTFSDPESVVDEAI